MKMNRPYKVNHKNIKIKFRSKQLCMEEVDENKVWKCILRKLIENRTIKEIMWGTTM